MTVECNRVTQIAGVNFSGSTKVTGLLEKMGISTSPKLKVMGLPTSMRMSYLLNQIQHQNSFSAMSQIAVISV